MAGFNVGAIEATLTLDRSPFQRSLKEARAEADAFTRNDVEAVLKLEDGMAKAKLDELKAKLFALTHRHQEIKIDVDKSALSRIESLFGSMGKGVSGVPFFGGLLSLPFKGVEGLLGGLQKLPGLLEEVGGFAQSAFQTVASTIQNLQSGATTIGQVLGSVVTGLGSVIASGGLALVAIGALVTVFGALASVVVSLVAALAALAASLAAAAAGAAALFVGAFAAAIPVIGVMVGFFARLAAVVKAHQAAQQAAKQAALQHTQALQQQHQAVQNLQQAQQNLKDQTVAAYQAMQQSAIDYEHALNAVANARLGVEGARLSLRQAKQDLKDFLSQSGAGGSLDALFQRFQNVDFNPEAAQKVFRGASGRNITGDQLLQLQEKLFAVKQAYQGVKNAQQSYGDSTRQLSQAEQRRNQFLQEGIAAYKPYEQALHQVRQAQDRLQVATTRVSSAQYTYQQRLKALSGTEQGFLGTLTKIEDTFGRIAKLVAAPIFKGIEAAFGPIQRLLADPAVQGGLVGIGRAIGSVIAQFGKTLDTKPWRDAFVQFEHSAAQLVRSGGKLFGGFLTVLREIARAALPSVIRMVRSLGDWFTNLGHKPKAIQDAVHFLIHQFNIWWGVAKALGGLIVAFIRNAAGAGGKLAGHLAKIIQHWTAWLNSHPGAIQRFFDNAVASTSSILANLGGVLSTLHDIATVIQKTKDLGDIFLGAARVVAAPVAAVGGALGRLSSGDVNPLDVAGAGIHEGIRSINRGAHQFSRGGRDLLGLPARPPARPRPPRPPARAHGSSVSGGVYIEHLHMTTPGGGHPDPQHFLAQLDRAAKRRGR